MVGTITQVSPESFPLCRSQNEPHSTRLKYIGFIVSELWIGFQFEGLQIQILLSLSVKPVHYFFFYTWELWVRQGMCLRLVWIASRWQIPSRDNYSVVERLVINTEGVQMEGNAELMKFGVIIQSGRKVSNQELNVKRLCGSINHSGTDWTSL